MNAVAALITTVLLLLILFWLGDAARPLAALKHTLWARYSSEIVLYLGLLILNIHALALVGVRVLGLKRTGRKLAHIDRELRTDSALAQELARFHDQNRQD